MGKLVPNSETIAAASNVLRSDALMSEVGRRAGLPQHADWIAGLTKLFDAVTYNQPLSRDAIEGAQALYQTVALGTIGLDYIESGRNLPAQDAEGTARALEMHNLAKGLWEAILKDPAARPTNLLANLGARLRSMLPT